MFKNEKIVKSSIIKNVLMCAVIAGCMNLGDSSSYAAEYNIYYFNNPDIPESSLINHAPGYVPGDILHIKNKITVEDNIGSLFKTSGIYFINSDGQGSFDGDGNSGFSIAKSIDLTVSNFKSATGNISLSNFNSTGNGSVFSNAGNLKIFDSLISSNSSDGYGGAIYNTGTLAINNVEFDNNIAKLNGGAIRSDGGIVNINNSKFTNNSSTTLNGGAFSSMHTSANIINSTFQENTAFNFGGAVCNELYMVIQNSIFKENSSKNGAGAIYNLGQLFIDNSYFESNSVTNGNGGAIMSDTGNISISNSTFMNNDGFNGGAIYSADGKNLSVLNSLFNYNTANNGNGGAISNNGVLTIINSVFTNNAATNLGGAVSFNGTELNIAGVGVIDQGSVNYGNIGPYEGNTVFSGNYSGVDSSGLIVYKNASGKNPVVNINAGNGGSVIFNDNMTLGTSGGDNSGQIVMNINKAMEYTGIGGSIQSAPTDGEISFNNKLNFNTPGLINIYDGKLSVITDGSNKNMSLNLYGGELNLKGGNRLNVDNFAIKGDSTLSLTADLLWGFSDFLNIKNFSKDSGALKIKEIHLLNQMDFDSQEKAVLYSYVTDNGAPIASLLYDKTYTAINVDSKNYTYEVSSGADVGGSYLLFSTLNDAGLKYATADSLSRSYSATGEELISNWNKGNFLEGDKLVIYGDNYSVKGDKNIAGLAVGYKDVNQTLEVNNVDKWSNFTTSYYDAAMKKGYGGALAVQGKNGKTSSIVIDNVRFEDNVAGLKDSVAYSKTFGGAVSVAGNSDASSLKIKNSDFENNTAIGKDSYGGAVAIALGSADIENTSFIKNSSVSNGMHGYGGALLLINNLSRLQGKNLTFKDNYVDTITNGTSYQRANGGAVYAEQTVSGLLSNILFENNYTIGYAATGGAISTGVPIGGQFTIVNSVFKNNHASATGTVLGGAIYNDNAGILNIVSNLGNTLFDGNYVEKIKKNNTTGEITSVSKTSEAIYNLGTVNFNASEKNNVMVNDKINGQNGVLNINSSYAYSGLNALENTTPTQGNIIFNNSVYNQTINLYDGMLSIGTDASKLQAGDEYLNNISLNAYSGILNTQNAQIDNLNLNSLSINGELTLNLDVDLANKVSDFITVNAPVSGTGRLIFDNIKIITDMKASVNSVETKFINQSIANAVLTDKGKSIATSEYIYDVSLTGNNTILKFDKANASLGLAQAVADKNIVVFSATKNELVGEWIEPTLNALQGNLTIQGNELTIMGLEDIIGIVVGKDNILNVVDVGKTTDGLISNSWKGFDTVITNAGGNVNITHSLFTNNIAANKTSANLDGSSSIYYGNGSVVNNIKDSLGNVGKTTINGGYFKGNNAENLGGAVYNDAELVLKSSLGNDLTFENNVAMTKEETNKYSNDIYQTSNGITKIEGDKGKITVNSGFAGEGSISKTGNNELVLGSKSDNSRFIGDFLSDNGVVTVKDGAKFLGGTSEIAGGSINWESKNKVGNGTLAINGGVLNVINKGYFTINDKISFDDVNANINIGEGSSVENTIDGYVVTGNLGGYNDGVNTTYGTFINSGTAIVTGDNSGFKGTFIQTAGKTTVETGAKVFLHGDLRGGTIIFVGDATLSAETTFTSANSDNKKSIELQSNRNSSSLFDIITKGDNKNLGIILSNNNRENIKTIYDSITLDEKINSLTIKDNITYVGDINVGSNATLAFDSENYDINFDNNITNLNDNSVLSIKTAAGRHITLDGNSAITGDAIINKTGDGTFLLEGDGRGFTGEFNQEGGVTSVSQNGYIFSGEKNINAGNLYIESNSGIDYKSVNLGNDTELVHTAVNILGGDLDNSVLSFKGTGANASYRGIQSVDAEGNPIKTEFNLKESISNTVDPGASNSITFNNATVKIGSDDYKDNTVYNFENSRISLVPKNGKDLRHIEFNTLTTSGDTKLDFNVDFNKNSLGNVELKSDFISAAGNILEQTLLVGDVRIRNDHDNGSHGNYSATVLGGGLEFVSQLVKTNLATTAYEYKLSVQGKDIKLDAVNASDENSLNAMNILDNLRYFMFSNKNAEVYHNAASLDPTSKGEFKVLGYSSDVAHSTISGFLVERDPDGKIIVTDKKGSLFNMADKTDLTIQDLTVEDTFKQNGSGSVVSIGTENLANNLAKTHINNVLIQRATATNDGGAIYNNGGKIDISNSIIKSSSSIMGNGGAINNKSGKIDLYNIILGGENAADGNTAKKGGAIATEANSETIIDTSIIANNKSELDGGAIYNEGVLTIKNKSTLANNSAEGGRGGAIYNTGVLTISSSTDNDIYLQDNKDKTGFNDIYQIAGGKTTIDGLGGKIVINSGIAGEGEIIKKGINELVLGNDSLNSDYTGKFTQTDGTLSVYGSFFGGENIIDNGTLNWNTLYAKSENSIIKVNGGDLNINGVYRLNNSEDLIAANAKTNITKDYSLYVNDGYVSLDRNGNDGDFANYDKWDGAVAVKGGILDYNLDKNNLLLAEGGTINVNGGTLTLAKVDYNGEKYTSIITDNVNINLGDALVADSKAKITINAKDAYLGIDGDDNWNSNGTVHLVDGTFNYNSRKANGAIIAEGGNLEVVDSILSLNFATDSVAKEVQTNINKDSILEIKDGSVTLDSNDILAGKITQLGSKGKLIIDNFQNNKNNVGGTYQQDSGTLIVQNNTSFGLSNRNSYITGGDVVIKDSSFVVTSNPAAFGADNLTLINSIFSSAKDFNVTNNLAMNNSLVSTINNEINTSNIQNLIVGSNSVAGFGIDISLKDSKYDKFIIEEISKDAYDAGVVNISDFNFIGGIPTDTQLTMQIFDASKIDDKIIFTSSDKPIVTPIGQYKLSSIGNGAYQLNMTGFNSEIYRSQASTMAVYQNQLVIDNILLDHMMLVSENLIAEESPNKYAATLPQFAPYQYSRKDGGLWYKSYVNLETLGMTQGVNVGNTAYGSLVGADFPLVKMKNGWKFLPTAYIGYNGSHQSLNNAGMYQNGGQGGFMGTFIKNDFIGSTLTYAGGYSNEYSAGGSSDQNGNWFAGTALKLAYNFHPTKNLIIQPTAFMAYNVFGQQSYYTNYGAFSMNSGMLNGINVAPGLNIIYGKGSWSVYGTVQYMYNINEQISGQAGNINLAALKMRHGYIEYGVGATKKWKDRLNSYFQVTLRNGGRTGIGFQLGLQYAFDINDFFKFVGKKKVSQPKVQTPPVKKVIKSLH